MIKLEVWLYGPLAKYAGDRSQGSYAQLEMEMPDGARMHDLLEQLGLSLEEKGFTFINAQLTDLPGLGAGLNHELHDGDRVGIFHKVSMWPFQYRLGASTSPELMEVMRRRGLLRHT